MTSSPLERALNVHHSVFIQACAGAGKTFALTKRYAAILDSFAAEARRGADPGDIDPGRILVITFTKKAAGEMASRIYQDTGILLSGREIPEMKAQGIDLCPVLRKDPHPAVREYARYLRESFSRHAIATIDAFCAKVLREFAHRSGLDPQFTVQEEADAAQLLETYLDRWIGQTAGRREPVLTALLEEMPASRTARMLKGIYKHREILQEHLARFSDQSDAEIWRDWLERYTPAFDEDLVIGGFLSLYKKAENLCTDPEDNLYKTLREMYENYSAIDVKDPAERRAAFLTRVIRKSGFIKKSDKEYRKDPEGNKLNWRDGKKETASWFEDVKNSISIGDLMGTPGPEDRRIIPLLRKLFELFRQFDADYLEVRKNRNVLDFSDIILFTHRLLRDNPDIRQKLAQRYRHVMVDEFQDTNPVRWEIIRSIFLSAGAEGEDNGIRLFIVGDRKQSIYRFNNADVTVMNDAETLIRERGGEILDFNDNYRSAENFIDKGINRIFGDAQIMPPEDSPRKPYEAFFESTVYTGKAQDRVERALEFHWCKKEDTVSDGYLPARHAAHRVREVLKELREAGVTRDPGKPLVGVLLRKFTHIGEYLRAFRMLDIPVSIVGGRGFYQSGAVRDVFHFLSVLDNPLDDHALAGLLRSPLMAVPDPEIHVLSDRERDTPLFRAMRDSGSPLLRACAAEIAQWRERSRHLTPDVLLTQIVEEKDAELGYVGELMPRQRLANLDKAVNIIGGLVRKGRSLRGIREYFHYQINHNTGEPQASYPEHAEVHILTVHKAKGLQFPAVVIPEMNASGRGNTESFRFGRKNGYPEVSISLPGEEHPGILYGLRTSSQEEEEAEEKRVFYVAVTRAVHKVCFLGEEGKQKDKNSWWNIFVRPVCGIGEKEDPDTWGAKGVRVHEAAEYAAEEEAADEAQRAAWIERPSFPACGTWRYCTPHDLMDGGGEAVFSGGSGESGLALGSCFHWCVERAWFEPEAHREALAERIADRYPEAEPGKIIDECRMLMKDLREHELYGILRDPGVEKYHELALTGWLMRDNDVLQVNGKIDLLFRHRGRWVVVDLKTDAGGENLQRYERQIRTYQWMLRQAYGIEAEGRLYFVRRNRYVRVDGDARYFDKLPAGPGYRPKLPPAGISTEKLPPLRDDAPRMLFCPSSHYASRLFLSLVSRGLMRPSVRIVTFSSWMRNRCVRCLSKDRLRLMILSDVPEASRGFGELMASAIFDHELEKGKLLPEFGSLYARIRKKRQTAGFASAAEQYNDSVLTEIPAGTKVGFMDLQPLLPLQQRIRERIGKQFESFSATLLPARTVKRPYSCIRAFSPREEVIAVARRIRSSGFSPGDILIAVSSMDKYAGLIARIFPQFGLPVRFIESPSAARSPSGMLLQEFLHLLSVDKPEWPDLAPVLMHPLCRPADDLREADRKYRANPEEEDFLPLRARHFIEQYRISGADDITETVERFIRDMELTADAEDDTLSAVERFREVLREVLRDMELLDCGKDPGLISAEVRTRLQKAAVRRRTHENGIPVVGYLDSAGLDPGHVFVMGMIEGDIPRREDSNPYLLSREYYSLKLNRYFMKKWMGLGERVTFSWPAHAEDGTEQQISAFLENIDKRIQAAPENGGRREQLLNYENRCIDADHPAVRRHNEIVRGDMGAFSGKVDETRTHFTLSVSAVDTLLACPMRFYYERILRIQPADQDAAAARAQKKGNVIHRILEDFGKRGGFELPVGEALPLLRSSVGKVFGDEGIDIEDPLVRDRFRYYVMNLEMDSRENCLVSMLRWNAKELRDYRSEKFERKFSRQSGDALHLKFGAADADINGKMDKIMLHKSEKHIIVSDYKTGSIPSSEAFKDCMRAQLLLYAMKAGELYPGYHADAAYEQIKNPGHLGNGGEGLHIYRQADGRFGKMKKNGDMGAGIDINIFQRVLEELFSHISRGEYYITDRPFDSACRHCPHEGLCRRDSRLWNGHDNGPAGLIYEQGDHDE